MVDTTLLFLVLIVVAVLGVSAVLAARNRLTFRIAMRNIRRSRGRTVLLILGLLVGTTIISGSFVVGDTVTQLNLHYTYLGGGYVDEAIYGIAPSGGNAYFPYSLYSQVAQHSGSNPSIAGITPAIIDVTQAYDRSTGIPQTNLNLIGTNANQSAALGGFVTDSGTLIAGPAPGEVLLDDEGARQMSATAGNILVLYGPHTTVVTVQAVVQDNVRGAYLTAGLSGGNVFVDLPTAQVIQNASGLINFIAVTNVGSQSSGVGLSSSVSASLNTTLAAIPGGGALKVHSPLQTSVASAIAGSVSTETIFLVLGLFSIVAGAMLIVGIFVMLAEERKGEMGMLRAVGLQRGDLIRIFYFEGLAYSVGSALAGTLLGVLAGYSLVWAFSILLSSGNVTSAAILQSFTVTPISLVESYVLGFLLTLVTVILASRRASRLNIVRAIRDIPEPPPSVRVYRYLAYLGVAVAALGVLVFLTSFRGSSDVSVPIIGGAMVILGGGLMASRFLKNRPVFSLVGLALLLWAGAEPFQTAILGSSHSGGIFVVFVAGIIMVAGALMLFVFNASSLVGGLLRLAAGRAGRTPVARVALAHPSRQPARTAITLSIFALVVFTMVAVATFGSTVESNLNNVITNESGGYTLVGFSTTPIPDLPGRVANNSSLASAFSAVVPLVSGAVNVNVTGYAMNPYADSLFAAPANAAPSSNFYSTNRFHFFATLNGMSEAQVWAALQTDPTAAVVDQNYDPAPGAIGGGPSAPHPLVQPGDSIKLSRPGSTAQTSVKVIGVLSESIITGVWINPHTAASAGAVNETAYFFTVRSGVSHSLADTEAKTAFFSAGLVLFDIGQLLATAIAGEEGVITLLEIFVGLGLAVGIAAMGIVALRAVVERRREIGMLRAQGFTQGMVLKSFVLEYSFITVLGLAIGTFLGVLIVYNLALSPNAAASGISTFSIPWVNIGIVLMTAYGLAMAAIAGPSLRASRVPPAEAVRSTD